IFWDSEDMWTVGEYNTSGSETRGRLVRNCSNSLAPSVGRRMTTRSTRLDAEGSSREARPDQEQKLDQMLVALAEANQKAKIAHKAILGLKDEVAEVRRDNAHLEGLLASEDRTQRREDFDEEVQQEFGSQPRGEAPILSGSRM
ncbi:hypothetical protein PanWU01x14_371190, partial [Parasponia andersonii]